MITLHCRPPDGTATEIVIGASVRSQIQERLQAQPRTHPPFALVDQHLVDHTIANWDQLTAGWHLHPITAGESVKSMAAAEAVLRQMVTTELDRNDLLIAIGGGSIGDLGGFCAALYLRGIEVWQVPTTLLAMVDSSVGGKTAVNLPEGKNLVGCVHAPSLVVVDLDFLTSLPDREFHSGLAESIKAGIGLDSELFELLEQQHERILARDLGVLTEVVHRSLAAKIAIVEGDLKETGARRLLNLGHTLGHALEAHADHTRPHGLCVARGMHFAIDLAEDAAALEPTDAGRCRALLQRYGHERDSLPPVDEIRPYLARDKKIEGAQVQFVLPTGIGRSRLQAMNLDQLAQGPGWA